jgi:hypothetical protein
MTSTIITRTAITMFKVPPRTTYLLPTFLSASKG